MTQIAAETLVRDLGRRLGDLVLSTPTSASGDRLRLIDAALVTQLPGPIPTVPATGAGFQAWVYGSRTADAANRGVERRAQRWDPTTATLWLYPPGFPVAPANGVYELHLRTSRAQKLAALNSGLRQLGLYWARPVEDTSLQTAAQTWRYTLPPSVPWASVQELEVELAPQTPGFPFESADRYDPAVYATTASDGTTQWILQFGILPPPGRTLRLRGHAWHPDLAADTDTVVLPDHLAGRAQEWLLDWALYRLWEWLANDVPNPAGAEAERRAAVQLERQRDLLLRLWHQPSTARVITPGRGTGRAHPTVVLGRLSGGWP